MDGQMDDGQRIYGSSSCVFTPHSLSLSGPDCLSGLFPFSFPWSVCFVVPFSARLDPGGSVVCRAEWAFTIWLPLAWLLITLHSGQLCIQPFAIVISLNVA